MKKDRVVLTLAVRVRMLPKGNLIIVCLFSSIIFYFLNSMMSLVIQLMKRDVKKRAFNEMKRRKEYEANEDAANGEEEEESVINVKNV